MTGEETAMAVLIRTPLVWGADEHCSGLEAAQVITDGQADPRWLWPEA